MTPTPTDFEKLVSAVRRIQDTIQFLSDGTSKFVLDTLREAFPDGLPSPGPPRMWTPRIGDIPNEKIWVRWTDRRWDSHLALLKPSDTLPADATTVLYLPWQPGDVLESLPPAPSVFPVKSSPAARSWSPIPPKGNEGLWWHSWRERGTGAREVRLVPEDLPWTNARLKTDTDLWLPHEDGDRRYTLPPFPDDPEPEPTAKESK